MDKINIKNPEDMKNFRTMMFTDRGYNTLTNYLKNLIDIYVFQEDYPITLPGVLGVPIFKYAMEINNHDELLGRIKLLGQILGVEDVQFTLENGKHVSFNMTGEVIIT